MKREELLKEIKAIENELDLVLDNNNAFGYKDVIMKDLIKGFFSPKFVDRYENIKDSTDIGFENFLSNRLLEYYKRSLKGILVNVKRFDLFSSYDKEALLYIGGDQGRYQKDAYKKEYNSSTTSDFNKFNSNTKLIEIVNKKKTSIDTLEEEKLNKYFEYLKKQIEKDIKKYNNSNTQEIMSLLEDNMELKAKVTFLQVSYDYIKVFNNFDSFMKKVNEVKEVVVKQYTKKEKRKKVKNVQEYPVGENNQLGFKGFEVSGRK